MSEADGSHQQNLVTLMESQLMMLPVFVLSVPKRKSQHHRSAPRLATAGSPRVFAECSQLSWCSSMPRRRSMSKQDSRAKLCGTLSSCTSQVFQVWLQTTIMNNLLLLTWCSHTEPRMSNPSYGFRIFGCFPEVLF